MEYYKKFVIMSLFMGFLWCYTGCAGIERPIPIQKQTSYVDSGLKRIALHAQEMKGKGNCVVKNGEAARIKYNDLDSEIPKDEIEMWYARFLESSDNGVCVVKNNEAARIKFNDLDSDGKIGPEDEIEMGYAKFSEDSEFPYLVLYKRVRLDGVLEDIVICGYEKGIGPIENRIENLFGLKK